MFYTYMDDMVLSLEKLDTQFSDLEELFKTIGKHRLKLNPEKCVHYIRARKFLGFLLTERWIKANPNKCATIIDMKSPASVKEVQRLTGKMNALSLFLSTSRDKGYHYFQCLQKNE